MELLFTELTHSYANDICSSPAQEVGPSIYLRMHNFILPILEILMFSQWARKEKSFLQRCFFFLGYLIWFKVGTSSSKWMWFSICKRHWDDLLILLIRNRHWNFRQDFIKGSACFSCYFPQAYYFQSIWPSILFFTVSSLSIPVLSVTPPMYVNTWK